MDNMAEVFISEECIIPLWKCEDCGYECEWSGHRASSDGTPVCGECGIDMHYKGTLINESVLKIMFKDYAEFSKDAKEAILKGNTVIPLKAIFIQ